MFHSIAVLDTDGNREYGDEINLNLAQEELLQPLVYDSSNQLYEGTIRDEEEKEVIVLCVPIFHNNRVSGIVMATVTVATLNSLMDQWGDTQDGCAFLMTDRGNYITGGKRFNEVLGGRSSNYFTYLSNCALTGDAESSSDVERFVKKKEECSLRYNYVGTKYIATLYPSEYGNWYVGCIENANVYYQNNLPLSQSTLVLLAAAGIAWLIAVIIFLREIYINACQESELERYGLVRAMEKAVFFEFQFSPKRVEFFGDVESLFGVRPRVLRGEEVYDIYKYVHEDDRSVRGRLHRFYDDNEMRKFVAEIRIINAKTENYGWYRISGILVKDDRMGLNIKFVAKLESADQQIVEERDLVQRAENDLLTGVLNKKTMEEKVTNALKGLSGHHHCIFFMVDLDNFKNVNDKLGHIYGDTAIVDTANCLSEIFKNDAYVGRLGGDEFAVCAKFDSFDEESLMSYIKKKAEKICEVNRRTYVNGSVSVSISSSVGIAVAPECGQDFETIYKMADNALYRSKNGGKNCYNIYKK
jgi:diguanylate cyclase (GGDEF)-like protein